MKLVKISAPLKSEAAAEQLADRMNHERDTLAQTDGNTIIVGHFVDDDGVPLDLEKRP